MSLQTEFEKVLANAASGTAVQTLSATAGNKQVVCELSALDSLACSILRLSVQSPALAKLGIDELKGVATRLSQRLTYLLEPISPIEVDAHGCIVQMRSSPPQRDDNGSTYYELLLNNSGEMSLVRYARSGADPRQIVSAHLTRQVLLRLVGDLEAAA